MSDRIAVGHRRLVREYTFLLDPPSTAARNRRRARLPRRAAAKTAPCARAARAARGSAPDSGRAQRRRAPAPSRKK
jgi:Tfp pilus assembly protein FimV